MSLFPNEVECLTMGFAGFLFSESIIHVLGLFFFSIGLLPLLLILRTSIYTRRVSYISLLLGQDTFNFQKREDNSYNELEDTECHINF